MRFIFAWELSGSQQVKLPAWRGPARVTWSVTGSQNTLKVGGKRRDVAFYRNNERGGTGGARGKHCSRSSRVTCDKIYEPGLLNLIVFFGRQKNELVTAYHEAFRLEPMGHI